MSVSANNLANEIIKALTEYTDEVRAEIQQAQDELSDDGVQMLKASSPADTGKYASSWKRKKTKTGYVIYNEKYYRLTHLLENGHAKRGGGRVAARVHIRPVEQRLVEQFERRVEGAIRP
jgi:hypothetical protein